MSTRDLEDAPRIDQLTGVKAAAQNAKKMDTAKSASLISAAVMLSRVLGLAREVVFSTLFGASKSYAADAFVMAFRIPNLLRDLFAEGALSSAFVTVFSGYVVTKDEKEAFRLSNLVATTLILTLGVLVILGIVFAEPIVFWFAHGYVNDPAKFALTVRLTRIMMPFILLVALAAQAMGILNARDRFGIPALSSALFNVGSIIGGVFFAVLLTGGHNFARPFACIRENPTEGIIGMAYGVLIGGFFQYAIQWPSLRRAGFRFRPAIDFSNPGLRTVLRLMGPAIIGGAATQINILINANFASYIPGDGPAAWLNYAFRLMQFPIGIFGVAIATVTLPSVSKSAALNNMDEFRHTIASSIRLALLLTIPSAVGLAVLGRPIIAMIYQYGRFTSADTDHVAATLACYAVGLAGYSAIKILAPAFYALNNARTPMMISLFTILVNFVMNWSLVGLLQERGLALSVSTVALINFSLLYIMMRKRIGSLEGRATSITVFKIIIAAGVMGMACWLVSAGMNSFMPGFENFSKVVARLVAVGTSVASGALVFYIAARILRIDELEIATDAVFARVLRAFKR